MGMTRSIDGFEAEMLALEASAVRAGAALACAFSSAAEFEAAVISAQRARGAYAPRNMWQIRLIVGATAAAAGLTLIALLI
jgi:hypothetical protein